MLVGSDCLLWQWLWVGLGVVLGIIKWGQIANKRRDIPGYARVSRY
jgi:hypothetical protein